MEQVLEGEITSRHTGISKTEYRHDEEGYPVAELVFPLHKRIHHFAFVNALERNGHGQDYAGQGRMKARLENTEPQPYAEQDVRHRTMVILLVNVEQHRNNHGSATEVHEL